MAAYVIVRVNVTDWQQYKQYLEVAPATIAKFGGRFIARGGDVLSLEGPEETRRVVILEFPSLERIKQWYNSKDYQAARELRIGAAQGELVAIEGV